MRTIVIGWLINEETKMSAEQKAQELGLTFSTSEPGYLNLCIRTGNLLFQRDEVWFFRQHEGGEFRLTQKIPVPVEVATVVPDAPHQKLSEITTIPQLSFEDFDGNGTRDFAYYRNETFGVYRQKKDGSFDLGGRYDLAVEKSKRRSKYIRFEIPPRVGDFNGDGAADLALSYTSKGRVHLYYARAGRTDFRLPDHVIKVGDAWSSAVHVLDLNGDKRSDLIAGAVRKLDVLSGIQTFLSKTVEMELHYYLSREEGGFAGEPNQILTFEIPFAIYATREEATLELVFRPNFTGDFDGDGLLDLLVRENETTLAVYRGDAKTAVQKKPSIRISISPPPGTTFIEPLVDDLNGDGRSDLILKHKPVDADHHVLELKLSK